MEEVRIDKWLWAVRLFKTRTMSADACKAGKVKYKGHSIKPSHTVKIGDVFEISIEQLVKTIEVKALLQNRVSAKLVPDYLIDLTSQEEYERIQFIRQYNFEKRDYGTGRPTKKERRAIDKLKTE